MPPSDEILIVGARIGGLTAAISLHEAGFNARVFESVPEINPLGVGINLLPHAVRGLEEMGLRDSPNRRSIQTPRWIRRDRTQCAQFPGGAHSLAVSMQ